MIKNKSSCPAPAKFLIFVLSRGENSFYKKIMKWADKLRPKLLFLRSGAAKVSLSGGNQAELDKKLVFSLAKKRIPSWSQFKHLKMFLSRRELWFIRLSFLLITLALTFLFFQYSHDHWVSGPAVGGEYCEALIGTPKYINPIYASISDLDSDLTALIFSSLFRRDGQGQLQPDLAENMEKNEDGRQYKIKIRSDAVWHDGQPLTVEDIIFTFQAIKDSEYHSPLRASFTGVEISRPTEDSVQFSLNEAYAAFPELLTFGILPKDIWQLIPPANATLSALNLKPIGSGPFKFKSLVKDQSGRLRTYELERNKDYYQNAPWIATVRFKFYPAYEEALSALAGQECDGLSYLPFNRRSEVAAVNQFNFYLLRQPQINAIFFNLKSGVGGERAVRQALARALPKKSLVAEIFGDYAQAIDGPIRPESFAYKDDFLKYEYDPAAAALSLEQAGWRLATITAEQVKTSQEQANADDETVRAPATEVLFFGPGLWRQKDGRWLKITLKMSDRGENLVLGQAIQNAWEKIGVKTVLTGLPATEIASQVIKTRDFEALLYGFMVGADPDIYPLWHSSQIGENGLNITGYSNKDADQLLEDARFANDQSVRKEKYGQFQEIIAADTPALFLYTAAYTYLQTKKIKGFAVDAIVAPYNRFANINDWYIKTAGTWR
ncbi:hypothetical protein COX69_03815 [Candidatus Falkowbacteria bacterium CG_4_10_14_0_2_um_filter_48_10]|nr:MAG: hypothetical protein COX69_03815 [Candidatus Falkowbacteria bacterium CG_4_10_14_0_2_um_filter_48_10]